MSDRWTVGTGRSYRCGAVPVLAVNRITGHMALLAILPAGEDLGRYLCRCGSWPWYSGPEHGYHSAALPRWHCRYQDCSGPRNPLPDPETLPPYVRQGGL